jgi:hypothetical protein
MCLSVPKYIQSFLSYQLIPALIGGENFFLNMDSS